MEKRKFEKKAKINISSLIFFNTIYLATLKVYTKFEDQGPIEAEKSVTESFVGEKEKWTNKGTDKQYVADSLLHSKTCHTRCLY